MNPPDEQEEPITTIVIDSEEVDDWMKSLPGYKDEAEIHDKIAAEYERPN